MFNTEPEQVPLVKHTCECWRIRAYKPLSLSLCTYLDSRKTETSTLSVNLIRPIFTSLLKTAQTIQQTNKSTNPTLTKVIVQQLLLTTVSPESHGDLHVVTGVKGEVEREEIIHGLRHQGEVNLHVQAARDALTVVRHSTRQHASGACGDRYSPRAVWKKSKLKS